MYTPLLLCARCYRVFFQKTDNMTEGYTLRPCADVGVRDASVTVWNVTIYDIHRERERERERKRELQPHTAAVLFLLHQAFPHMRSHVFTHDG